VRLAAQGFCGVAAGASKGIFKDMGLKSFCLAVALLWCAGARAADTNSMRTIFKGAFSGIQEESQIVVTNRIDWEKVWKRHGARSEPKEPAPEIDFKKETVLVVAQGQKRTGGYSIEIAEVRRKDGKAQVLVKSKAPKPGGLTIQALTAPIHIVAVPKLDAKVEFKTE
jgi:hypothetical protein